MAGADRRLRGSADDARAAPALIRPPAAAGRRPSMPGHLRAGRRCARALRACLAARLPRNT